MAGVAAPFAPGMRACAIVPLRFVAALKATVGSSCRKYLSHASATSLGTRSAERAPPLGMQLSKRNSGVSVGQRGSASAPTSRVRRVADALCGLLIKLSLRIR